MASQKLFLVVFMFQLLLVPLAFDLADAKGGLKLEFYRKTCPNIEQIVRKLTYRYIKAAPTLAAPILRMQFHDCFVNGCDASIMINSTSNNVSERDSPPNAFLRGYQIIDAVKTALEKACPRTVSCADVLALVVRDSVSMIGGPYWKVQLGRRDGRVSSSAQALAVLPSSRSNITQLKTLWASKGLNAKDLAVLSGAHTIGVGHCFLMEHRLYNFTGKNDMDPNLDSAYITQLKKKCKPTVGAPDTTKFVQMDPGSFKIFDTSYYSMVTKKRGLFESDSALMNDPVTKAYTVSQASTKRSTFFKDFGKSMVKLAGVEVLTGRAGEIRKQCSFVN